MMRRYFRRYKNKTVKIISYMVVIRRIFFSADQIDQMNSNMNRWTDTREEAVDRDRTPLGTGNWHAIAKTTPSHRNGDFRNS